VKGGPTVEFSILYFLQDMNHPFLDPIMIGVSTLGNSGMIWIVLTIFMLFVRKYRESAFAMIIALLLSLLICNLALKNIVQRDRPFWIDPTVILKIDEPSEFSFPSGHTFSSFAAAVTLYLFHRKIGFAAIVLAIMIAFSRLYLFVHFPTDVLASVVLGSVTAVIAVRTVQKYIRPVILKAGFIPVSVEVTTEGENYEIRNDETDRK